MYNMVKESYKKFNFTSSIILLFIITIIINIKIANCSNSNILKFLEIKSSSSEEEDEISRCIKIGGKVGNVLKYSLKLYICSQISSIRVKSSF